MKNSARRENRGTLEELGGCILHMEGGRARIRYAVKPEHCNPRGVLQGGMAAVFLDDAMGYAVLSLLGEEALFTTIDMTLHYLSPVGPGTLVAEGWVVRAGERIIYLEGQLAREDGSGPYVRACSTVMRLR